MRRKLLLWFSKVGRTLPWRQTSDPYAITVSEIMLQQTQVDRVIPKYRAFLKKFPDWRSLAKASQSDVVKMWHGLGYNRRALQLHKLAKVLVERVPVTTPRLRGVASNAKNAIPPVVGMESELLPRSISELEKLPGIGPYTANAIAAFAFRDPDAAPVDTNIERVIKRVFGAHAKNRKEIEELASVIAPRDVWSWNHALMDLGATVCTARSPKCDECPLKTICGAYPCAGEDIQKNKQPKFEDSDRQFRGRIISLLRKNNVLRRNTLSGEIGLADETRIDKIVRGLIKDGFIHETRGKITLV